MKKKILLSLITSFLVLSNRSNIIGPNDSNGKLEKLPFEIVDERDSQQIEKESFALNNDSSQSLNKVGATYFDSFRIEGNCASAEFEEDENNSSFETAETISPYFKNPNEFISLDRFDVHTYGKIDFYNPNNQHKYDIDYFKFYLYGFSSVYLQLGGAGFTCNYDFALYSYNADRITNIDYGVSTIFESTSGYRRMNINLAAGLYFVKIYPKDMSRIDKEKEYDFFMDCRYKKGENYTANELRYNKGAKAAIWCSDFYLFNNKPFTKFGQEICGTYDYEHFSYDNYLHYRLRDKTVSGVYFNFDNYDKILSSSLFIWGLKAREELCKILDNFIEAKENILSQYREIEIKFTTAKEVSNVVESTWAALQIGIGIFSFFVDPTGVVKVLIIADLIYNSLDLLSGGSTVDLVLRTIFPEVERIEKLEAYVNFLKDLRKEIKPAETTSDSEIIRINSFFEFRPVEDFDDIEFVINYTYEFDRVGRECKIEETQNQAFCHGRTYPLIDIENDIENAREFRFDLEYKDVNTGGEAAYERGKYVDLNIGEYHWYYYEAPETCLYEFTSNTVNSSNENLDVYGELFTDIVPGRSVEGRLAFNDNSDEDNDFSIIARLEQGQKVYIRVRGTNWDTFGRYCLIVSRYGDATLHQDVLNAQKLNFARTYNETVERTTVCLTDETPLYTERVRCACISWEKKKYLTLSAKARSINTAYLAFEFVLPIETLSFDIGLWSKDENLTGNTNSKIRFLIVDRPGSSSWKEYYNFNISKMSKDKDSLEHFDFDFGYPVYKIKFLVETSMTQLASNKGRVVLDNIAIFYR